MKSSAPLLFDRSALRAHRARARREALFLHETALGEVQDRLSMVNRSFTSPAIVTPFPAIWEPAFPEAVIVPDEDTLQLDAGEHDLVIHAMGLHWSNDPIGQLIQCRRALVEDGLGLAVLLGGQTLQELRVALSQAESRVAGGLSPRIAPMAEIRELGGLLQRAGFALPVADTVNLTAHYRDLRHLMSDLRAMGETNALAGRMRHFTRRGVLEAAEEIYRSQFATADARLPATFELAFLTGWSPADSQPRPLRPGTAQMRLADALRTTEKKLPD